MTTRLTSHRRVLAPALVVLASALATSCIPPPPAPPTGYGDVYLTRDGRDTLTYRTEPVELAVTAPAANRGSNTRAVFWRAGSTVSTDATSCVTFTGTDATVQQGVALRVASQPGRARAVTVTKNVWGYASQVFNVHVWDTSRTDPLPATLVSSADLSASVGHPTTGLAPFPWRLCASVVGSTVRFKVWPTSRPEPSWTDPTAASTATLPPGWVYPGRAGAYVGHVRPTTRAGYRDLATTPYPALVPVVPPTTTTTTS